MQTRLVIKVKALKLCKRGTLDLANGVQLRDDQTQVIKMKIKQEEDNTGELKVRNQK